jgi:dihydrofolate synthase / folylpolyglutamate synthase
MIFVIVFTKCFKQIRQVKNYDRIIDYLYEHLPFYQRSGPAAYKDNLSNTLALDRMYDHPHRKYKTIHVAGTNGKGSVSNMLASILKESGLKTGLYTSPHLKDFRERIRVDGEMISKDFVVRFVDEFRNKRNTIQLEPSFFELTVMMAFEYFAEEKVDVAVIEVGLGGRLDSTNIITPELSIITNISYDHMAILGDTLGKIALEKAGIIKKNIPVVIGETHPETEVIFKGVATNMKAPFVFADQQLKAEDSSARSENQQVFSVYRAGEVVYKDLSLDLLGSYQKKNICTLLASVEELRKKDFDISESQIRQGLRNVTLNTGLSGRWQIIGKNPTVVCDIAHNPAGIGEVVAQLKKTKYTQLHIILGTVNDKDVDGILYLLPKGAEYYFTRAAIPRALDENKLKAKAEKFKLHGDAYPSVKEAYESALGKSNPEDLVMILGSTFVVAEVIP